MKLGERKTIDGKEYAIVYHSKSSCEHCVFYTIHDTCEEVYNKTGCKTYENGRWQEIVWIEVKK